MVASIQLRGALLCLALAAFANQVVNGCIPVVNGCVQAQSRSDDGRTLYAQTLLELNELSTLEDETLWQQNKAKCASETYDVSLFIYHHLALVASPANPNSDCLAITFDVVSDGNKLSTHKRVIVDKEIIEKEYLVKSSMHNIDQRNFGDITGAFDLMVDLGARGDYDVMDNNCAKYVLETLKLLEITPMKYPKAVMFTKKRLAETGNYIAEGVRNHPDASMYFGGATTEEISDEAALDVVIQYNIDKHA